MKQEVDDNDYQSEASLSDDVDTDFSIDENDEVKSDDDDEPKRKKRLVTKAYKVQCHWELVSKINWQKCSKICRMI